MLLRFAAVFEAFCIAIFLKSAECFMKPLTISSQSSVTLAAAAILDGKEIRNPISPLGDTVIVKLSKPKRTTEGGLFLPELSKTPPSTGIVVATGPGKRHWETGQMYPMHVKEGQNVFFGRYDGAQIVYNGEDHLLLRNDDILFTYTGEEPIPDTIEMIGDRILVKIVLELEQVKSSGIIIASSVARENKETTGEVVKLGPGKIAPNGKLMPSHCAVGDFIKYRDYSAEWLNVDSLKVEGSTFVVIKNTDVVAKW